MKFFDLGKAALSLAMADFNRHVNCEFRPESGYVNPLRFETLSSSVSHMSLMTKDVLINPVYIKSLCYVTYQ